MTLQANPETLRRAASFLPAEGAAVQGRDQVKVGALKEISMQNPPEGHLVGGWNDRVEQQSRERYAIALMSAPGPTWLSRPG
ncbi:hypothetical protein [Kyrpidia spormannii]|uniref:Uncharacterized protein n=1 Tax=Kyrpidia spormannii TaxID=2055160 RepID=A0ACA8Z5M4_9BACL|nr:hypothetical protein [Kyrpidia spormannii]CAB3389883.1 protein of unknown function [Kyrpidia spormannii]